MGLYVFFWVKWFDEFGPLVRLKTNFKQTCSVSTLNNLKMIEQTVKTKNNRKKAENSYSLYTLSVSLPILSIYMFSQTTSFIYLLVTASFLHSYQP